MKNRGDRPFIEIRHKFGAQTSKQPDGANEYRDRRNHDDPTRGERDAQHRLVSRLSGADREIVAFANLAAQQERAKNRHQCQSENERTGEGEHHRHRHRVKHFSFDASEGEDRDVNDGDNDNAEKHRVRDLFAGSKHNLQSLLVREPAPEFVLPDSELAHHVFDDHHRSVDDQAEIHRAKAHQVT